MRHRHSVHTCADDPALLEALLKDIADRGARIVSVMWAPTRTYKSRDYEAGYVVVAEEPRA